MKNYKIFDNDYFLGYIKKVSSYGVQIHFPNAKLLDSFHYESIFFHGGNVGNFVIIESHPFCFLAQIMEVELPDSERKEIDETSIHEFNSGFHPIATAELLLSFNVFEPEKIEKTASRFPHIGAKVYACPNDLLGRYIHLMKDTGKEENDIGFNMGHILSNQISCRLSGNSILNRHCAIVGTTGGGKSWSTAKLLEEMMKNTDNKIIIIDPTGEYESVAKNNSFIMGENCFLGYRHISNTYFCVLFQENSPNTITALCDALTSLKIISLDNSFDGIKAGKNIADIEELIVKNINNIYDETDFNLNDLASQIRNECVKPNKAIYTMDDFKLSYCSHLIARVNLFLHNNTFRAAFGLDQQDEKQDIIKIIDDFLKDDTPETCLRISFQTLPFDFSVRETVVDFIAEHILEKARKRVFQDKPVVIFIDEAHQFLNKKINIDNNNSFNLTNISAIAKEGRKYGLFLCLATQMPREIPVETLSQFGTFIVHRLINDLDRKTIESACSSANRNALAILPVLGPGEALITGVGFPMPMVIKIEPPQNTPKSHTPALIPKK